MKNSTSVLNKGSTRFAFLLANPKGCGKQQAKASAWQRVFCIAGEAEHAKVVPTMKDF
jgi:hypothetical protein